MTVRPVDWRGNSDSWRWRPADRHRLLHICLRCSEHSRFPGCPVLPFPQSPAQASSGHDYRHGSAQLSCSSTAASAAVAPAGIRVAVAALCHYRRRRRCYGCRCRRRSS